MSELSEGRRKAVIWLGAVAILLSSGGFKFALAQNSKQSARHFVEMRERARELVKEGRIRPLREIVRMLRGRINGEIIDVDLVELGGGYFYQFKVLPPNGYIDQLFVDAKSPEILTLPQARERFPKEIAGLEEESKAPREDLMALNGSLTDLPPRLHSVMQDLQERVEGKIVGFNFHRVANSLVFVFDVRTDKGSVHRFFVHARTGEIRTPEQARPFIARRFPWLLNELYPPAARLK